MRDADDDLMSDRVVLERFQEFTDGALDGYAAGLAARRIGGPAEANLRALPPLDRELSIEVDGERAVLRDGETGVSLHPQIHTLKECWCRRFRCRCHHRWGRCCRECCGL
jgi:hypothetical protein